MKLIFDDMDVRIVRTFRLAEPIVLERDDGNVLVEKVSVMKRTWQTGEFDDEWSVWGARLKKDGTRDERKGGAEWHRLWRPSFEGLPDHRQPFIDALEALDNEKGNASG